MKENINLFISSILAGVCISIGCIVNIMSGGGVAGAILFTFGLITVVHYKYSLYTGTAGFVSSFNDIIKLFIVTLLGNILGCILTSYLGLYAIPGLSSGVDGIVVGRLDFNALQAFIRAIFCGFLMTTAVKFARENRWLPLLFAVPVFILAGFYHSIADTFYFFSCSYALNLKWHYLMEIIGNFLGCNLYRVKFLNN